MASIPVFHPGGEKNWPRIPKERSAAMAINASTAHAETDTGRRYMIIQDALSNSFQLSISQSCQALEVSRSGYCKWRKEREAIPSGNSEDVHLRDEIQEIALEFPGYGYRRITAELQNRGYTVNHKRVLRLMRQDNLLCLKTRFKPVTTDSSHGLPVYPNLLKDTKIIGLNQVWASDITYIPAAA